jgi:hypothetical protein
MSVSVQHEVVVRCSPARAFALFTERPDVWWPANHRLLSDSTFSLEPRVGGRLVERAAGEERVWAEVLEWSPSARLRLSWRMGNAVTHALIDFTPDGPATRVRVEHTPGPSGLVGPDWQARAVRFDAGWTDLLGAFSGELT